MNIFIIFAFGTATLNLITSGLLIYSSILNRRTARLLTEMVRSNAPNYRKIP